MDTVLIFDREKLLACELKDILEEEGDYKITVSTTPEDAIASIKAIRPNVILFDLLLQFDFDYENLISEIKKVSPNSMMIAMTAIDDELHIQRAFNSGVLRHILKPCSIEEIKRIVRETIEGKSSDPNWGWTSDACE